jgi:hypothetical protein
MANDSYRMRQDILHDHMEHIQDLGRDNEVLTHLLEAAESEIGRLNLKVEWLEDELCELKAKRNGTPSTIGRFVDNEASGHPYTPSKISSLKPGVYTAHSK